MTAKISRRFGFARQNFSKKNLRGFTLLETMVAIAILLIAVVGPISIIGSSLNKIYFARDQVVAINLAQEGIEAVRAVRDSNMLNNIITWDNDFQASQCGVGQKECIVNLSYHVAIPLIQSCSGGAGGASCDATESLVYACTDSLYYQGIGGMLGQTPCTPTIFRRVITTQRILASAVEDRVTSTVKWNTGNTQGAVTVSESVFNWAH